MQNTMNVSLLTFKGQNRIELSKKRFAENIKDKQYLISSGDFSIWWCYTTVWLL